jgi:hypothetical protein
VSLGTGFKRGPALEDGGHEKLSFFRARCVPRLFRSFLNFLGGETRWQELRNSLSPEFRDRYHRLNLEYFGDEPELDDVQAMPSLRQYARQHASSNSDVTRCADNLLASLFYLELARLPEFERTTFVCKGWIRCRLGPSHQALRALAIRLMDSQARFQLGFGCSLPCIDADAHRLIELGGAFSLPIAFQVLSLEDSIDIKIEGLTETPRSISNCPYRIETLIKDQGFYQTFGHKNNKKRKAIEIETRSKRARISP